MPAKPFNVSLFLKKIYLFKFLTSFIVFQSVYALMFKDFGVSDTGVSALFIIWCLSVIVFEIPSGILGDKYNRRKLLMLSQIIKAFVFIIWITMPNFYGFALGFLLWGIPWTIDTGTYEAFLYDELKAHKQEHLYTKACGRSYFCSQMGYAFALPVGTFLMQYGYDVVAFTSILPSLSFLILYTIPDSPKTISETESTNIKSLLSNAAYMFKNTTVLFLGLMMITIAAISCTDDYHPLIVKELGIPTFYIGSILLFIQLMSSFGAWISYKFEHLSNQKLFGMILLTGLISGIIGFTYNMFSIFFIAFLFMMLSLVYVLLLSRVQHLVKSNVRATFLSLYGMLDNIGVAMCYALVGGIVLSGSYQYTFIAFAIIIFAIATLCAHKLFKSSSKTV